jgi:hypothetical protein
MNKAVKVGLIIATLHLILFGLVWVMGNFQLGCSDWGCLGYLVLASLPWSLLLVYLSVPTYLVNGFVIIVLNFATYFLIGYLLALLFSRKSKPPVASDNSNG